MMPMIMMPMIMMPMIMIPMIMILIMMVKILAPKNSHIFLVNRFSNFLRTFDSKFKILLQTSDIL